MGSNLSVMPKNSNQNKGSNLRAILENPKQREGLESVRVAGEPETKGRD